MMLTAYQERLLKDRRMWITLFILVFFCIVIIRGLVDDNSTFQENAEIEEINRDEEFGDIETLLEDY